MKSRMTKKLKFWVDVACAQRKARTSPEGRHALVSEVLHEFEMAGDAMRYLRADGKIGWKPTQWMLDRLADAEREAWKMRSMIFRDRGAHPAQSDRG
jgi:hypothetical protein